jgi:hypothetical protein
MFNEEQNEGNFALRVTISRLLRHGPTISPSTPISIDTYFPNTSLSHIEKKTDGYITLYIILKVSSNLGTEISLFSFLCVEVFWNLKFCGSLGWKLQRFWNIELLNTMKMETINFSESKWFFNQTSRLYILEVNNRHTHAFRMSSISCHFRSCPVRMV